MWHRAEAVATSIVVRVECVSDVGCPIRRRGLSHVAMFGSTSRASTTRVGGWSRKFNSAGWLGSVTQHDAVVGPHFTRARRRVDPQSRFPPTALGCPFQWEGAREDSEWSSCHGRQSWFGGDLRACRSGCLQTRTTGGRREPASSRSSSKAFC